MATTPTSLPIPSEDPRDLKFNAGKFDEVMSSDAHYYADRFGVQRWTIEGFQYTATEAIAQFGYITLDSFEDGATITLPNQTLRYEATGEYYRWDGAFPPGGKVVAPASTPTSAGGIGVGAWLSVGDATLRSVLVSTGGAAFVKTSSGQSVQHYVDIVADIGSFGLLNQASYASIRAYNGTSSLIYCYGRSTIKDGAQGVFRRDPSISSPVDDDGITLVDALGRAWVRVDSGVVVNPAWFGVKYDGTDDSVALQKAINAAANKTLSLGGIATVASTINLNSPIKLTSHSGNQVGNTGIVKNTAGTMINVGAVNSGVDISNIALTHNGDGRVISLADGETHRIHNCSIVAGSTGSTNDVIYFIGSNTWITDNRITSFRPNAFCINCDRTTKIQINSIISRNYFGGTGKGIRAGTSTGSARPEGLLVSENTCVLTGECFLHVFSILSLRCIGNMIDQCNNTCIKLEPITFPVEDVRITNNYIASATNSLEGIGIRCIKNTGGSVVSGLLVNDNKFEHSGYGFISSSETNWVRLVNNDFSTINHAAISIDQSVAVLIHGNNVNIASTSYYMSIVDGDAGGNFNIMGNYFIGLLAQTKSHPERWQIANNTGYS